MSKKNERNKILLRNEYGKFVGTETLEDGTTRICLVDSPLKALDYKSLLFFFKKKKIIANAEKFLSTKLEEKKYVIVEKPDIFVVGKDGFYIKKKELIITKDTDVNNLTLEQMNVISGIPVNSDKDIKVVYYGLIEDKFQADQFKKEKIAKKIIPKAEKMYGDGFKIELL